jgi:lysophospholipase L1-like esterase
LSDPTPATVVVTVVDPSWEPVIIDNADAGFSTIGTWGYSSAIPGYYGSNYRYIDESPDDNSANWAFDLTESKYDIFAQWSADENRATNAKFTIFNNGIELRKYWANQRIDGGQFNYIGSFYVQGGTQEVVLSEIKKMNGRIIADAVKFENICQADPCIYVQSPQDYYIQTSNEIQVSAVVQSQDPMTYGVLFILDEGTPDEQQSWDSTTPFNANFTVPVPSETEHSISVYLTTNSSTTPIGGPCSNDFIDSVGIGNYLVAMGDSTTDGVGDEDISNDISNDSRNGGGSYPPVLNDLLTAFHNGVPHTVVNEGVPGARSSGGAAIVNSLLAKHPDAQRFLLQFGINDARAAPSVPSGLGLNPGDPGYNQSYKHNLQQMIDAINGAGREVCLAKVPIILGETNTGPRYSDPANPPVGSVGDFVVQYNLVVDELVANLANNITISPDLWSKFNEIITGGQPIHEIEYYDNFHMNGSGYDTTAVEWYNEIVN